MEFFGKGNVLVYAEKAMSRQWGSHVPCWRVGRTSFTLRRRSDSSEEELILPMLV